MEYYSAIKKNSLESMYDKNHYNIVISLQLIKIYGKKINAGEVVEKREPSYTVGGNAN